MEKKKEQLELANALLKVAEDIRTLADSIQAAYSGPSDASTEKASITLEKVRGFLAEKSRSGHTAEVKAILRKFGADRLSDIDPKDYAAVLKDAEVL